MTETLTDTHVHLCAPDFADDLQSVLARAEAQGIGRFVAVGETMADARRTLELSERHPGLLPAAGLYPGHADRKEAASLAELIRQERGRLAAIGEVGLDFRLAETEQARALQREVFSLFIELALELELPLNVHSRSAGRQTTQVLLEHGATRVQMHAFDGKAGSAADAVQAGYFFSVPPSVLRSRQKEKLVRQLPLSCLLLESDAPALGPSPGERNEPAKALLALRSIAGIKGLAEEEVWEAVLQNTRRLYGRPVDTA